MISFATIKTKADGKPQRPKYRIYVLGDFDPNNWSRNKVFDPFFSYLELRPIITIAVQKRYKVKKGYFKQSFCKSYLLDGETYVLRLPKDFLITPPNMYLQTIRTLYGLNIIPRHWHEKARATFLYIGLKQNKNSPCIFSGSIVPDQPLIILGL